MDRIGPCLALGYCRLPTQPCEHGDSVMSLRDLARSSLLSPPLPAFLTVEVGARPDHPIIGMRRSGVSSDLWLPKIPSSRIRAARQNQKSSKNSGTRDGAQCRGLLRSHREHRRAHGLAGLQVAMRLYGVFQRIGLLDLDLDRTREHHSEEILCHRREIGTGGSVGV